jgi:DNA-binding beta-propeller fold protein YncE
MALHIVASGRQFITAHPRRSKQRRFPLSHSLNFKIDEKPDSIQHLVPTGKSERFEGLAFSTSGNTLGIATADTNAVLLFRQQPNGRFDDTPYRRIEGLDYPHDLSFSMCGSIELMAIAQRSGAIPLYRVDETRDGFVPERIFEISGPTSKLAFSDGVAFVPPHNDWLAACNLITNSISFYPRVSQSPVRFAVTPDFELTHPSLAHPDGLAFSRCGTWLAVANHGNNTVSVFSRRNKLLTMGKLRYGPEPISIIADGQLLYPHSVAFTPRTNHLVVTNAGGNFFRAYGPSRGRLRMNWNRPTSSQISVGEDSVFQGVNAENKMEGGPKGLAVHGNKIAVCSPEFGIKIYSFQED